MRRVKGPVERQEKSLQLPRQRKLVHQLVHTHLSLLLKEFERYIPTEKVNPPPNWQRVDPRPICESSRSMGKENKLLEMANDGGLESMI